MRKLIVVLCALFVLAGCGSVAKEVTPQAPETKPDISQSPVTANTTALIPTSSLVVTQTIVVTADSVVSIDVVITPSEVALPAANTVSAQTEISVNITISNNQLVMEITSEDTVLETLLASQGFNGDYEVLPDGVVATVPQAPAKYAEGVISNGQEICQVALASGTAVFVSTEPAVSPQLACAETTPVTVVYY